MRRPAPLPFKRVPVAKTTHFGDLVIGMPLPTALKRRDPEGTVIVPTNGKTVEMALACADIDELWRRAPQAWKRPPPLAVEFRSIGDN